MPAQRSVVAALFLSAAVTAQIPCWESNLGTFLGLGDDAYAPAQPLGFTFQFGGVGYTDIVICSNGYVWLGQVPPNNLAPDYTPTQAELVSQGPRIAPLWCDFNPSAPGSGNVHFNSFPAAGAAPARAVVTWDNVYEYGQTTPLSLQLQLIDGGSIIFHYDSNMAVVAGGFGSNPHEVGTSNGSGIANAVNFTALPIVSLGNPTLHQTIARGAFPLVGKDIEFLADGTGGFIVTERTACNAGAFLGYGSGCPRGMSTYELFEGARPFDLSNLSFHFIRGGNGGYTVVPGPGFDQSYSNPITMQDDTILVGQTLGFQFPFAGGSHAAVDLSSNGMIYMTGATHGTINGYPTAATMLNDPVGIIAFLWQDLDLGTGGQAYWDVGTGVATYTIVNAPYWNQGGSNTTQLKLFQSGDIIMNWLQCASVASGPCMVGISEGGGAFDFGSIDWSTALPRSISPAGTMPLLLSAQAGSRPAINSTFALEIGNLPAGTSLGAMVLSFARQNLPLGAVGMQDCFQLAGLDAVFVLVVAPPVATFQFGIPNNTTFLGTVLFGQAAAFSAGYNALGVIASNGGEIRVGL